MQVGPPRSLVAVWCLLGWCGVALRERMTNTLGIAPAASAPAAKPAAVVDFLLAQVTLQNKFAYLICHLGSFGDDAHSCRAARDSGWESRPLPRYPQVEQHIYISFLDPVLA